MIKILPYSGFVSSVVDAMCRCILFPLLVVSSPSIAADLPDLGVELTLSACLVYAAENNPGLRAASNRWQSAEALAEQADSLPDPTFSMGYFFEEVETRVGPQEMKFGLRQKLPWMGTRGLREAIALQGAAAIHEDYEQARRELFFEVRRIYYDYTYLQRAASITRANIDLLKHLESVARSRLKAGGPQTDVIKAQVELGSLENRLSALEDLQEPVAAQLNAAMNRPPTALLAKPVIEVQQDPILDEEALFGRLQDNPILRKLDRMTERSEQSIALARKKGWPDLVLGVDAIQTGDARSPGVSGSGDDAIIGIVAFDLPVWRTAYKAGVTSARYERSAVMLDKEHQGNRLQAELKMALYRFRDATRKMLLYRDSLLPQADQALNVTEEAYRVGAGDFLDLMDAERLLLEFQLAYARALADRGVAWAQIERLVGEVKGSRHEVDVGEALRLDGRPRGE